MHQNFVRCELLKKTTLAVRVKERSLVFTEMDCPQDFVSNSWLKVKKKETNYVNVNLSRDQSKNVGKKSLLRTLQTLGSVPDWRSDSRQQNSDSEVEETPSVAPTHSKKKKKRRKRQKQEDQTAELQENRDVDSDEEPLAKERKKDNKSGE